MQLAANFHLAEFLRSQTAARMGRTVPAPTGQELENLRTLAKYVLQPVRDVVGPLIITSGYRPDWLNAAVGGSRRSAHMTARAADIQALEATPLELAKVCVRLMEREALPADKVILEFGQWVHIQVARPGADPRRRVLSAVHDGQRTQYLLGLHESMPS